MPFSPLFSAASSLKALATLQKEFGDARTSMIRIRADRIRLARTGWRPRAPSETKLIRAANWKTERADEVESEVSRSWIDFDLDAEFVPTEGAFIEFVNKIEKLSGTESSTRVFIRGIELEEPRLNLSGRPVCAAFFDLVLALSRDARARIVLPRVDGYLEARFWAEVARVLEGALDFPKGTLRFYVGLETAGGLVEAEEILFELKETVVGIFYDVRLDHFDALLMDSGLPALPREDVSRALWGGDEIRSRVESLERLARNRGVHLEKSPVGALLPTGGESAPFSLDDLRAKAGFAFRFLRDWFGGNPTPEGRNWRDFELARALLWTAVRSGFLREENYDAWREEFGSPPFEPGTIEEASIRTLDPLVRTAVFPDSAKPLAFSVLLELEKTRSVNSLRLA